MVTSSKYRYLEVKKHTGSPPDGYVEIYRDRWWVVGPGGKGLVIYAGHGGCHQSPQCNKSYDLIVRLSKGAVEHEVRFFAFVWLDHGCNDYTT